MERYGTRTELVSEILDQIQEKQEEEQIMKMNAQLRLLLKPDADEARTPGSFSNQHVLHLQEPDYKALLGLPIVASCEPACARKQAYFVMIIGIYEFCVLIRTH